MTTILDRPRSRTAGGTALSGTLPQVNLLPPEVRVARGLRATKRWLAIGIVVVVAFAAGGYGIALVDAASAESELVQAQDDTARLQAEQSKYAEVPQVLSALSNAQLARALGMGQDVQWKSYVDAMTAVLPEHVNVDTLLVALTPASSSAPAATTPLQTPSVGQITFTARALAVPDTAAWIDALNSVPGFAGTTITSAAVTEDENGAYYQVSGTVQITEAAFSHRFDPKDGEG
ncbi:hypothetical protein Cch01nite_10990 [Cellulomonas chitinilytica]|uniref:Fimbrial assembly protein n=1 Tax=Cellulomonas chitinilytica TaxID=398759 RepID=A0A919TYA2_9CELL|nr:fimbrial assembly protein [Cellulomonas chitinilytica]GIG20375.1 hypothetical protein Cch01nite_10990 [Cellulomonas chitinilytica]